MHSADELRRAGVARGMQKALTELRERAQREADGVAELGFAGLDPRRGLFALDNATGALEAAGHGSESLR